MKKILSIVLMAILLSSGHVSLAQVQNSSVNAIENLHAPPHVIVAYQAPEQITFEITAFETSYVFFEKQITATPVVVALNLKLNDKAFANYVNAGDYRSWRRCENLPLLNKNLAFKSTD